MTDDASEFWDDIWATMEELSTAPDQLLVTQIKGLSPGRALELGCGMGSNAVWLAERGWRVTAMDFSENAIEKARQLARERGVDVEFVIADASSYQTDGEYDLVTSFYVQLSPEQRVKMLSLAGEALVPGGTLLFVSHDRSNPPAEWSKEDLLSLTTPDKIVSELPSLKIEQAYVLEHDDGAHAHGSVVYRPSTSTTTRSFFIMRIAKLITHAATFRTRPMNHTMPAAP